MLIGELAHQWGDIRQGIFAWLVLGRGALRRLAGRRLLRRRLGLGLLRPGLLGLLLRSFGVLGILFLGLSVLVLGLGGLFGVLRLGFSLSFCFGFFLGCGLVALVLRLLCGLVFLLFLLLRGVRRAGLLGGSIADASDYFAHVHSVVFLGQDFHEGSGNWGRDLGVNLVGGDLEEWFVYLDLVAWLLEPLGDGAFGDGLTEFWHDHIFGLAGALRIGACRILGLGLILVRLICGFFFVLVGSGRLLFSSVFGVIGIVCAIGIGRSFILITDLGDDGAHVYRVILISNDLEEHTGYWRRDFGIDLVGGNLQQRFIDLDLVANLLQPLSHSAFSYGLAQFRHFDGMRHGVAAPLAKQKSAVVVSG